jgi:tetratricopeptide (TPR) repeat protein
VRTIHNKKAWTLADEKALKAAQNPGQKLDQRLTRLIEAGWLKKALKIAEAATRKSDKNDRAWKAVAALSFELGFHKNALRASKKALKLNPRIDLLEPLR